jgi:hypothetical protein
MYDYLKDSSITNICNFHGMSCPAVTSLANDLCLMMLSDYNVHNRQEEHNLGSDIRYHHVHIDESNFGKQKNHRGHRVEGIWVFGMVECLVPINEADRFYTYIDHRTGEQELRPRYEAGHKFFCMVPNRTAATLLPIIYDNWQRGSTIRSDGWRAYSGLHPREERDENTCEILDNTSAYNDGNFFFARHQVVNHSLDFATVDQVQGNQGEYSGLPISGKIHTNMIESMWAPLKAFIKSRNRSKNNCYKRILEYLWRSENASNIKQCFERMIREVAMSSNPAERSAETEDWFTHGLDGNSPSVSARIAARDARRFEAWVERRRARDARDLIEEEAVLTDDGSTIIGSDGEVMQSSILEARSSLGQFGIQNSIAADNDEAGAPSPTVISSIGRPRSERRSVGRPRAIVPSVSNHSGSRRRSIGRPRAGSRSVGRPRRSEDLTNGFSNH